MDSLPDVPTRIVEQFSIYPNPFNSEITINSPNDDHIEIRSISGTLIDSFSITSGVTKINLNYLNNGVYFISSYENNQIIKIVKQ